MTEYISSCCKAYASIKSSGVGTNYYVCAACRRPCDVELPGHNFGFDCKAVNSVRLDHLIPCPACQTVLEEAVTWANKKEVEAMFKFYQCPNCEGKHD